MRSLFLLALALTAQALDIGDPAPSLMGTTWLKAGPVNPAKGIAVIEFWATWCAPCQESIPHLTDLAKRHEGKLTIAGLSDEERDTVLPFIAAQGKDMEYPVGIVDAPTKQAWMDGRESLPTAFAIGYDGKVAWIGHPMELDPVLAALMAGTWDPAKAKRLGALEGELQALLQNQNGAFEAVLPRVLAKTDELLAIDPAHVRVLGLRRGLAKHLRKPAVFFDALAGIPADLDTARSIALTDLLLEEPDLAYRAPRLAVRLAEQITKAMPEDADAWARLAQAHAATGRVGAAIKAQQKANHLRPNDVGQAAMRTLDAMEDLRSIEVDED